MRASLTEQLNQLPPCIVRLLAHERRRALSTREIADRSKLSMMMVWRISNMTSWDGLRIDVAEAFAKGCRYDLLRPRRSWQYLSRFIRTGSGLSHLNERQLDNLSKMLDKI